MSYFIQETPLSRRQCLAMGLAGLGLSGCGRRRSVKSASQGPTRALTVYAWTNYFSHEALELFHKETGQEVVYLVYPDPEEMEARIRSEPGTFDVVVIDSFNLRRLAQLGLLAPLSNEKLTGRHHIDPKFLNQSFDPENRFSVPHMWGTTLIAYRKDKIQEPERSWNLLWNQRYAGRVMMIDEKYDPIAAALIRSGRDVARASAEHYEEAMQALIQQVEGMDVRYGADLDVMEGLERGNVWAAMCYSGDAAEVASRCPEVDFFIPREGAAQWIDSLVIARDCPMPDQAHALVDFMLRPDVAALNATTTRFATPNASALTMLPRELAADERIFPPPDLLKKCYPLPPLDKDLEQIVNKSWHGVQRARALRDATRTVEQK